MQGTGRAGRAGWAFYDAGGEGIALQCRREAALAFVALVALKPYVTNYVINQYLTM